MSARLQRGADPERCHHSQTSRLVLNPQPLLNTVHYVADWVASFPHDQHSPPHPLKSVHTPPPIREEGDRNNPFPR